MKKCLIFVLLLSASSSAFAGFETVDMDAIQRQKTDTMLRNQEEMLKVLRTISESLTGLRSDIQRSTAVQEKILKLTAEKDNSAEGKKSPQ